MVKIIQISLQLYVLRFPQQMLLKWLLAEVLCHHFKHCTTGHKNPEPPFSLFAVTSDSYVLVASSSVIVLVCSWSCISWTSC